MLKMLLAMAAIIAVTVTPAIEPTEISPTVPSAGEPINALVTTGPCDALGFNNQNIAFQVDVQDLIIEMTLVIALVPCNIPVITDEIPIGMLEAGEYSLVTYSVEPDVQFPVDPAERTLLFETNFSVGPAASAVPALSVPNTALLILLLSGLGLYFVRKGKSY